MWIISVAGIARLLRACAVRETPKGNLITLLATSTPSNRLRESLVRFVAILMLALLWICSALARRTRIRDPGPIITRLGNILFWFGCVVGVYFFGMFFFVLAQPGDRPPQLLGFIVGTAILWPAIGWLVRHLLGHNPATARE